jgi:hypothetical protein
MPLVVLHLQRNQEVSLVLISLRFPTSDAPIDV